VSWASRLAVAIGASAALASASCSATPILKIDQEFEAIDLASCVAGVDPCVRTGGVTVVQSLLPGDAHELELPAPSSVDAPLRQPAADQRRFAYLALGLNNVSGAGTLEISIVGDDSTKVVIAPPASFTRVEIDMREITPKPGARLKLRCVTGTIDVTYAIGRWFVP
jgi:hypothetical protein